MSESPVSFNRFSGRVPVHEPLCDKAETYILAGLGAIEGIYKYYVKPELTAKRAWSAIGAGVLAYEIACPAGETLSEGVDRALDRHKLITGLAISAVALHLMNVLPGKVDVVHQLALLAKRS